jgi:hypothetical protein
MVAIKLYDIETGNVQTLAQVSSQENARVWLENFRSGGQGTNDVVYTANVDEA